MLCKGGACILTLVSSVQDEHHPLLRPSLFQPALSLSGAASLARVDSSFGMRALEKLNPQGEPAAKHRCNAI